MANFLITFILTIFLFGINEAVSRYWFTNSQLAPTLLGLTELIIGVYAGLPVPVAQSMIWGGGLTSIRQGWQNYDRIKNDWKPIYLIGNFVAIFLIWRLAQGVKVDQISDTVSSLFDFPYPTTQTLDDAVGAEYPMIIRIK